MWPVLREVQLKFYAYINYLIVFITGLARDMFDRMTGKGRIPPPPGYVPIFNDFSDFFTRRFYNRINDCFARVVTSNAGAYVDVKIAEKSQKLNQDTVYTGEIRKVMNLGSYNYLGFGDPDTYCTPAVLESLKKYGPACSGSRVDAGTTDEHKRLELTVAEFFGTEDAICYGMGWATNATTLPVFVRKGDLVISDSLNHNSIITGVRSSGASVQVFRHNDMEHLEKIIRRQIIAGQPRTRRPWGKILVIVEGIYSMEGEMVKLQELVALKKKYNFYIWLDEAHSIGCMGSHGRGVCEHLGVPHKDIDILMGTFTKSFGAAGGYITGSKRMIDYLRLQSFSNVYADSMPVPVAVQARKVIEVLMNDPEGERRLKQLHDNSIWFRNELRQRKFKILGDNGSPVVPIILPPFSLFTTATRECLNRNIGLVAVCFPACDILEGRVRICLNSQHSKEELLTAIEAIEDVLKGLPAKTE